MRIGHRVVIPVIQRGRGVIGGRLGQFHLQQHIGLLVLHRLERSDRLTELHAHHRIGQRILPQPVGPTDHFVGQTDRCLDHRAGERGRRAAGRTERAGRHALELEAGEFARRVHRFQGAAGEPLGIAVDGEQ